MDVSPPAADMLALEVVERMLSEGGDFYAKGAAAGNIDPRYGLHVLRADGWPSQLLRPDQLQQAPSLVIAPCLYTGPAAAHLPRSSLTPKPKLARRPVCPCRERTPVAAAETRRARGRRGNCAL